MIVPVIVCVYMCACGFVGARVHAPVNLVCGIRLRALCAVQEVLVTAKGGSIKDRCRFTHITDKVHACLIYQLVHR